MRLTIDCSSLASAVSMVGRAVSGRPSRPVLANILMTAAGDTLTLCGFDEALGITATIDAGVSEDGALAVPAKLLENILGKLGGVFLNLSRNDDTLIIESPSGRFELLGMPGEMFPQLPSLPDAQETPMDMAVFLAGISRASVAASNDETKQVLCGVYIDGVDGALDFAATDGHRLSVASFHDLIDGPTVTATVPVRAFRELERISKGANGLSMRMDRSMAIFTVGDVVLSTRLLEGQYPNYRQLIPKRFTSEVIFARREMMAALERIAVLAEQKSNIVRLDISKEGIVINVDCQSVGSGREMVYGHLAGDPVKLAFNVRYLLDGLKTTEKKKVLLSMNTALTPAIIRPVSSDDEGADVASTYLLMPVQLRSD